MADNALARYIQNELYSPILGRVGEDAGVKWWEDAALQNGWSNEMLKEAFTNGAQGELQGRAPNGLEVGVMDPSPYAAFSSDPAPRYTDFASKEFNFEADPGYQFRLDQGNKAIQNRQLASGDFFSGGALKEISEFNSGLASQEFGNAFGRYMDTDARDFRTHQANYGGHMGEWNANDSAAFRNNQANFANTTALNEIAYNRNFNEEQVDFANTTALNAMAYDRSFNEDQRDYNRWVDSYHRDVDAYNRELDADNTNWNRLAYLDGSGQNAAAMTGQAGQNAANNISQANMAAGNARANGYINSANGWTNAIGNAMYAYNAYGNGGAGGNISGRWNGTDFSG